MRCRAHGEAFKFFRISLFSSESYPVGLFFLLFLRLKLKLKKGRMNSGERPPGGFRSPILSRSPSSRRGPAKDCAPWFPPSSPRARSTGGKVSPCDPPSQRGGPDPLRQKFTWTRSPRVSPKSEAASRSFTTSRRRTRAPRPPIWPGGCSITVRSRTRASSS